MIVFCPAYKLIAVVIAFAQLDNYLIFADKLYRIILANAYFLYIRNVILFAFDHDDIILYLGDRFE